MIRLSDFPQLRMLAWNRPAEVEVDEAEALALYEANWRFVEPETLNEAEVALLRRLVQEQGAGLLLV